METNFEDSKSLDEPVLHDIAIALLKNDYWSLYLSPEQKRKYISILNDTLLWNRFINVIEWDKLCDEKDSNGSNDDEEDDLDITTLFRCRCMIFDAKINPALFDLSSTSSGSIEHVDHQNISLEASLAEEEERKKGDAKKSEATGRQLFDDDDFDESDAEDSSKATITLDLQKDKSLRKSIIDLKSVDIDDMGKSSLRYSYILTF